eukprot:1161670-Pelagomonas_calceolata.AAC.21
MNRDREQIAAGKEKLQPLPLHRTRCLHAYDVKLREPGSSIPCRPGLQQGLAGHGGSAAAAAAVAVAAATLAAHPCCHCCLLACLLLEHHRLEPSKLPSWPR